MDELAEMKERAKQVWALGDYPAVARRFEIAAEGLVAAAGIGAGQHVLDAAAGNGNVAMAAARAGARVTAADFTPSLVEAGRARTAAAGLDVTWDEADVEALPYADGTFDAVLSTFGLMFAPQPEVAVSEAFRVLQPGGVVGLTAWTPDGFTGQVTALMGEHLKFPLGAARPIDWGIEAIARGRLSVHAEQIDFARDAVEWEFDSLDDAMAWQEANFGALISARRALGEDEYRGLRERFVELMREWNRGTNGEVRLPAAYLRVVARKG